MNDTAIQPSFKRDGRIGVIVATSGYCNARCESCVWPFMENDQRVMSNADFARLLSRFQGYEIDEFALNVINEPFVDKNIGAKVRLFVESGLSAKVLFFSSNWLIPGLNAIDDFAHAAMTAARAPQIGRVDINATISGIDAASYDRWQAGAALKGTVAPYRPLNFDHAVDAIVRCITMIEELGWPGNKLVVRLKAYGEIFDLDTYRNFWKRRLGDAGLASLLKSGQVRILANHDYTTFARKNCTNNSGSVGLCRSRWLDTRLAVGPGGDVGLCCEDGMRSVVLGNLLTQSLDEFIVSPAFQNYLAVTLGRNIAAPDSPCRRCQFFDAVAVEQGETR